MIQRYISIVMIGELATWHLHLWYRIYLCRPNVILKQHQNLSLSTRNPCVLTL